MRVRRRWPAAAAAGLARRPPVPERSSITLQATLNLTLATGAASQPLNGQPVTFVEGPARRGILGTANTVAPNGVATLPTPVVLDAGAANPAQFVAQAPNFDGTTTVTSNTLSLQVALLVLTLTADPATGVQAGDNVTFTATLLDLAQGGSGQGVPGVNVTIFLNGQAVGSGLTDAAGQLNVTVTLPATGAYAGSAQVDPAAIVGGPVQTQQDTVVVAAPFVPASLAVSPPSMRTLVGRQLRLAARALAAGGQPLPGLSITFILSGTPPPPALQAAAALEALGEGGAASDGNGVAAAAPTAAAAAAPPEDGNLQAAALGSYGGRVLGRSVSMTGADGVAMAVVRPQWEGELVVVAPAPGANGALVASNAAHILVDGPYYAKQQQEEAATVAEEEQQRHAEASSRPEDQQEHDRSDGTY